MKSDNLQSNKTKIVVWELVKFCDVGGMGVLILVLSLYNY